MSDRPKREETILYNDTLFRKGDIVTIGTSGYYGREYTGRISGIDIWDFRLDMSEQYQEDCRKFKYDEISYIKYAAEPEVSVPMDSESQQGGQA